MTRLARGAATYLKQSDGNLCLQVRASDYERTLGAVEAARPLIFEIRSTHEPAESAASYVSEPMRLPDGPAVMIDMADEPASVLRKVADVLVEQVEAAGVLDAEVGPPRNRKDAPFWTSTEVTGVWYPQLLLRSRSDVRSGAPSIPADWVEALLDWLFAKTAMTDAIWVAVVSLGFPVEASAARQFLTPPAGGIVQFAAGTDTMRQLHYSGVGMHEAVLSTTGPAVTRPDSVQVAETLKALARSLSAQVDYAALDYRQTGNYEDPSVRHGIHPHTHRGSSHPRHLVPDVFAWQILGPEHIALLDEPPREAQPLDGDRSEVAFGDFADWRDGSRLRWTRRGEARAVLRPLLAWQPARILVKRQDSDWGTLADVSVKIENALPGGSWTSPRRYELRTPAHPVEVEIEVGPRFGSVLFYPAGRAATALVRQVALSFPGEIEEHPLVETREQQL